MVEFVCVGLDIRSKIAPRGVSADATVWEKEESLYERAQSELGITGNGFQLLHPCADDDFSNLVRLMMAEAEGVLISLWLPRIVVDVCPQAKGGFPMINFHGNTWSTLGFDVCDVDGFFSYIDMISTLSTPVRIFDEIELMDAFATAQAANFSVRAHSPFVVVELKSFVGVFGSNGLSPP